MKIWDFTHESKVDLILVKINLKSGKIMFTRHRKNHMAIREVFNKEFYRTQHLEMHQWAEFNHEEIHQ
jgi:hypothetical protein